MTNRIFDPIPRIATELNIPVARVAAVVQLFEEGNTIPFIARYRKEATGNLDEVQIRDIQERRTYLLELEDRRETILKSIESQGKLSEELKKQIEASETKAALEDLYLPYKPKRRTRAMIAREKGLEPLAELILAQGSESPHEAAAAFVDAEKGVDDVEAALAGARDICAEIASEDAEVRGFIREAFANDGVVVSKALPGKEKESSKFEQYYDFREACRTIPSHRYLAIRRGEREDFLDFQIEVESEPLIAKMNDHFGVKLSSPWSPQLEEAVDDAFHRLISPSVETDMRVDLKMRSDTSAVEIFADNLDKLLMAAPVGAKTIIGIDPGLRTGCKVAVVDQTGKFLENTTFYLTQSEGSKQRAGVELMALVDRFRPFAIAIGNGTGNREAEAFVKQSLSQFDVKDIIVIQVNEAGASVYSASDVAREEFPELDLTVRGAISIARRLQDPLAELVKIDPKSIGVGQYQHDVYQPMLSDKLHDVVESCVNRVGVDLNTASPSLLSYVAGIGASVAKKIVKHREASGPFQSRDDLLSVPGLGPRTYEQAAGFLRIRDGKNPLDASAVHPERYKLVEKIALDLGSSVGDLIGQAGKVDAIDIHKYETADVGSFTLKDILDELKKPGRDPRASFEPPAFRDDIVTIEDLSVGMQLEGVVTNVTAFGAFVDVGVHQDGLVHVSQLSDRFIKDPNEAVAVGDRLKVRVLEVDVPRKRISLTAKKDGASVRLRDGAKKGGGKSKEKFANNPFADLF